LNEAFDVCGDVVSPRMEALRRMLSTRGGQVPGSAQSLASDWRDRRRAAAVAFLTRSIRL
jgi:hypothetical protein